MRLANWRDLSRSDFTGAGHRTHVARPPAPDPRATRTYAEAMRAIHQARELKTPQGRREQQRFLIEGVRLVEDALDRGVRPVEVFMTPHLLDSTPRGQRLAQRLRQEVTTLYEVNGRSLALAADTETPAGVILVAALPEQTQALPILSGPGLQALVLDQLRDPGNTGGILRMVPPHLASSSPFHLRVPWTSGRRRLCAPAPAPIFALSCIVADQTLRWKTG